MKPQWRPMTDAEVREMLFERYRHHLGRAATLEGDFAVETAQAGSVLATIAANGWMDDYRAWSAKK